MHVKSGLEVLRHEGYKPLFGQRVGLLTNPSAIDRQLNTAYSVLCRDHRVNVVALFAPEYGYSGAMWPGEEVLHRTDSLTGLPVYSLYGDYFRPTADMLKDIDVIVCDVQDIGVRYHSFVWTISHLLEAAGETDITVVLLDRPNPLGSLTVHGPLLDDAYSSLVGRYPVPVIHGLTLGELTWMINENYNGTLARLSIFGCEHLEREMNWEHTGLPWVSPAPDLPHLSTIHHYPGACLVEGTNLSEGRGTTLPYEVVGAPWIDSLKLADHLNTQDWHSEYGVRFRAHVFKPTYNKWAGLYCQGVQVYIVERSKWRPIEAWLHVIAEIRALYPVEFEWLSPDPDTGLYLFDRLAGSDAIRNGLETGISIKDMAAGWQAGSDAFRHQSEPFRLYNYAERDDGD